MQPTSSQSAPEPALSPLKRAFIALENSQQRVAMLERAAGEPIAVIGIGCRVPGADSPKAFWQLMRDGVDAIGTVPPDRFDIDALFDPDPEAIGRIATRHGGFIDKVDQFDSGFFGIAPREAQGIDPQQRLLLEVSWEALENAGQAPTRLETTKTGVYFGLCTNDYSYLQVLSGDPSLLNAHFGSGIAHSIASGRLSYLLGLQGPSLTVDTACSSSLVAVHLATQALRNGDCRMALAGGANLILGPEIFIALSHSRMLAPDGRCKTFSAQADGFSRGEGCGVVVLKKLVDAAADGDRVLAVIRGTAINQDGPSSALTAPNGPAQEDVVRTALARAGVKPRDIGYIEAHGTGTQLGDPLEVEALGAVFRGDRGSGAPLVIGSVKTNIGHLEGAAGVVGLIKLVLSLRNKQIPPHLHMKEPNPHIDWTSMPVKVTASLIPWDPIDGRRIGGVSSFGFSGTNAHVIVEEAPPESSPQAEKAAAATVPTANVLVVSARDVAALSAHADQYAVALADGERNLADICHTANFGRSHFAERAAVIGRTTLEMSDRLAALARGEAVPGVRRARLSKRDPARIAFIYTGQGSQYSGMARRLHEVCPAFRDAFDRCACLLEPLLPRSLHDVVFADGGELSELNSTAYTQPALFAVEYALTEMWRSFGVTPSLVAGHSVGEIVAATVAGVFSLEDAIRLIARRGSLMASLPAGGAMAAIAASEKEVAEAIARQPDKVAIAAVNAPNQIVISGAAAAVEKISASFASKGVKCQKLAVSHAFHSPLMDPILDAFEREMKALKLSAPRLLLISNLTGRPAEPREVTGTRYWRRHVREAVRFGDCVTAILAQKPDCIVEIGPHPALLALFGSDGPPLIGSLRKTRDDWEHVLESASALFLAGAEIDWRGAARGERRAIVDLPTYPFQRQRHWFKARTPATTSVLNRSVLPEMRDLHPLLGRRLQSPLLQAQFEARLSASFPSFIGDHRIDGSILLPGAACVELARAAGVAVFGSVPTIEDLVLREAMVFTETDDRLVQTIVDPLADGRATFQVQSKPAGAEGPWTLHFRGAFRPEPAAAQSGLSQSISVIAARCAKVVSVDKFYEMLRHQGAQFGPSFRVLRELKSGMREAFSRIEVPDEVRGEVEAYGVHPVLLDGCLQTVASLFAEVDPEALYLPVGMRQLRLFLPLNERAVCHALLHETREGVGPASSIAGSIRLYNPDGELAVEIEGLEFQLVDASTRRRLASRSKMPLYERVWETKLAARTTSAAPNPCWVVLGTRCGIGGAVMSALKARRERCLLVETSSTAQSEAEWATLPRKWREALGGLTGIIDLRWIEHGAEASASRSEIEAILRRGVEGSLSLVKSLTRGDAVEQLPRLWLVTRGAQPAGDEGVPLSPWASTAWGLAWSVALEHPQLRTVSIDLDPAADPNEAQSLLTEIGLDGSEGQVAFRGGERWVPRLQRHEVRSNLAAVPVLKAIADASYRLVSPQQGSLDELRLAPEDRRAPTFGEVEIDVEASGLNFRDVLNVLGLYPGEAGPLGGECAGVVARLGPGVRGLREGDRVIAMAAGSFAKYVLARQELVQPLPRGVTSAEGAAIPIAYLTASYALEELAQIKASDRVLIHAAAGGVGLAAVHLALRAGSQIFATAGSSTKRAHLHAIGVRHVFDSRDPIFADKILALTNGEGVDVIVNSLSGPMMEATFRTSARGSRFIELGKRGVWTHEQVSGIGRDIAYNVVDLGEVAEQQPALINGLFKRLVDDISNDVLPRPLVTVFPLNAASAAFRYMMQARQIGKISVLHSPSRSAAPLVRTDGLYLVTGGNSGIGLSIAEWLVKRGARHLVLAGRRGETRESAVAIARMTASGASVTTASIDISDVAALDDLLKRLRIEGPPLRGILHAAGIVDDAALGGQDWPRFERVLQPKAMGAVHLDRLTRKDPLDWFVLVSSAASILGSPGQANYTAANMVLDVIAHERRRLGRPAQSINWGPWSEIGLAAGASIQERLAASGLSPMTPQNALLAFEEVMSLDTVQVGVLDADWLKLVEKREATGIMPRYLAKLALGRRSEAGNAAEQKHSTNIRAQLAALAPGRRPVLLRDFIRSSAIRVLGCDSSTQDFDDEGPLAEAGLDSLLSVELRNVLNRALELNLPSTLLFDHPTIHSLSRYVWDELQSSGDRGGRDSAKTSFQEPRSGAAVLAGIAELSDEEVEKLVSDKQR